MTTYEPPDVHIGPTAEVAYLILWHADDDLTQSEIAERSSRTTRGIRESLYELEDKGLVERRTGVTEGDARCNVYAVDK